MNEARADLDRADALAARAHRDAAQYPRLMAALGGTYGAFVLAIGVAPGGLGWFLTVLLPFAAAVGLIVAWTARLQAGVTACVQSIRVPLFASSVVVGFGLGLLPAADEGNEVILTLLVALAAAGPLLVGAWLYRRRLRRGLAGE